MKRLSIILTCLLTLTGCATTAVSFKDCKTYKQKYGYDLRTIYNEAEAGHLKMQDKLGGIYQSGDGVQKNMNKAIYWWRKAANLGYANSQYNLGFAYYSGYLKPRSNAKLWFEKAAEQNHSLAQTNLGVIAWGEKDESKAIEYFKKAIKNGDITAAANLSGLYAEKNDEENMLKYAKMAIEKNYLNVYSNLWKYYIIIKKDHEKGLKWLNEAKDKNVPDAYAYLSIYYMEGEIVEKDEKKSLEYFKKALKLKSPLAIQLIRKNAKNKR